MRKIIKILLAAALMLAIIIMVFVPINISRGTPGNVEGIPLIIGHRGACGVAPENTLPSIDSALAAGADMIEIDVHLSKDGRLIVMHDETVDRTTDGEGSIAEMTYAEIGKLDAGSWFDPKYAGTKVPTLGDVISHIDGQTRLLIEIKKKRDQYPGIEKKVIEVIRKHDAASWCVVQSFNDGVLELIHQEDPGIELQKLIVFKYRFIPYVFDGSMTRFSMKKYAYVSSINMHYKFFNSKFSKLVHDSGKTIYLWGCREEEPCKAMNEPGWEGAITDYPRTWKAIYKPHQ